MLERKQINNRIVFDYKEDVKVVPPLPLFSSFLLYLDFNIGWPSWLDRAESSIFFFFNTSQNHEFTPGGRAQQQLSAFSSSVWNLKFERKKKKNHCN